MKYAKSAIKREFILEKARKVFVEKGFAKVTMKDIVEACGISRGGLYLYFSSTKDIFLNVLQIENKKDFLLVEEAIEKKLSAKEILMGYFNRYKKNMLENERTLTMAMFEFFSENKEESVIFGWQFDNMAEMFREMIEYGINTNEFISVDATFMSRHMAQMITGLTLTVPLLKFSEEHIDNEIRFLIQPLITN